MDPEKLYSAINFLIGISAVTLISVITFGWKVIRFINRTEFKLDVLWEDYEYRLRLYRASKNEPQNSNS